RMEKVRRKVLLEALDLYEAFLKQKGDGQAVRWRTACAHRLVGDLHEMLGDHGRAKAHYLAAASLYRRLIHEFPPRAWKSPEYPQELARVYLNLSVVLEREGPDQAWRVLDGALALLGDYPGEPGAEGVRPDRATMLNNR